jgi:hypothetical protein
MVAEWYFARGGLLSAGAFAKFIKDPIFTSTFTWKMAASGGSQYERIEFTSR